jgi:hypothetical protein
MPQPWEQFEFDPEELIKQSAAKYGADPKLLKATAKVESNFNPKAKSPAGAKGMMQLMPKTAKSLGVKDPYDVAQSIEGAAKLQGQLLKKYNGDKDKAAAAYNAGEPAVDKAGGVPDIPETKDYVDKIKAEYQAQGGGLQPWEQFADNREQLQRQHEYNKAAGRAQDISGGLQTAAAAVRGAAPAAAMFAGPLAPIVYAGGEAGGQLLEQAAGARQQLNPYTIAGEGALGAIPWPDLALKLAARTPIPKTAYTLLKGPEGALYGAANTAAAHGIGALTSGLPGAEGSESPPWDPGEAVAAGLTGGALATLGSFARIHSIARQANDISYNSASNNLYRGIDMPAKGGRAEAYGKTFDRFLPIIHWYTNNHPEIKINSLDDLRTTSEKLTGDFYRERYLPLVAPIKDEHVSTQPIHDALNGYLESNAKLMIEKPQLKDRIMKKVEAFKGASLSVDDFLKLRRQYNEATKKMNEGIATNQNLSLSTEKQADAVINKAIRETLNDYVEKRYAGNADVRETLKNEADIMRMNDHIREVSQTWDAEKRAQSGERAKVVSTLARGMSRSSARGGAHGVIGSGISAIYEKINNPDSLVKTAFNKLGRATPSYDTQQLPSGPIPMTVLAQRPGQQQGGQAAPQPATDLSTRLRLKGGSLPALPQRTAPDEEFF